ncbi:MAG: carbon-nitrogen hydrolase family protein [Gammaproteobacteria bacterium]|nr:carbon-nitrogen hydrolase family protein [Gammaproteobacteria bacterium]MCY4219962.1 carbon-nitrogen hydrolase family protein [Gammaproteobacteria bacterium]
MLRIAAVQTNSSSDIEDNLERIVPILEQCRDDGCVMVVLPECFALMQKHRRQLIDRAEKFGSGLIQDWLASESNRLGMYLIGGSIPLQSDDPVRITNSSLVYNDLGTCIARYDKIFLFDVQLSKDESYTESDYTKAGSRIVVVDTPLGNIGLSICYDLRFPELYRSLVNCGANVLVVPSAFAYRTGFVHWTPLLKARAIENTSYFVAPAQFGTHNGNRKTWGNTMILNPWGKVIQRLEEGWGYISANVNLQEIESVRKQLPSLKHQRFDIFGTPSSSSE